MYIEITSLSVSISMMRCTDAMVAKSHSTTGNEYAIDGVMQSGGQDDIRYNGTHCRQGAINCLGLSYCLLIMEDITTPKVQSTVPLKVSYVHLVKVHILQQLQLLSN